LSNVVYPLISTGTLKDRTQIDVWVQDRIVSCLNNLAVYPYPRTYKEFCNLYDLNEDAIQCYYKQDDTNEEYPLILDVFWPTETLDEEGEIIHMCHLRNEEISTNKIKLKSIIEEQTIEDEFDMIIKELNELSMSNDSEDQITRKHKNLLKDVHKELTTKHPLPAEPEEDITIPTDVINLSESKGNCFIM